LDIADDKIKFPTISIITVVLNAELGIEKTIESVLGQSYPNIEYIIIDGGSTDQTLNIIKKYQEKISILISKTDNGIYDAMNKGIKLASGEYLNFMNAGDYFYENDTIKNLFSEIKDEVLIYGDVFVIDNQINKEYYVKALKFNKNNLIKKGTGTVCHQTGFIKRVLAPFYDIKYKYRAELNWYFDILEKIENNGQICYKNMPVACYHTGGLGEKRVWKQLNETLKINFKRSGLNGVIVNFPNYFIMIMSHYKLLRNLLNIGVRFKKKIKNG
jgi:glycosyltransferase involved in cell wall biosynthesis